MKTENFIQAEVFMPRLQHSGILVVYDEHRMYRDLCLDMATDKLVVIDVASGGIEGRELALETLCNMGRSTVSAPEMLIYVPARRPVTDEEKQRDPFSVYTACGAVFPQGDKDDFLSICLRAKPNHAPEIRKVFAEDPLPGFAVIDAIGGGGGWPTLQALLSADSAHGILMSLLAPSEEQRAALAEQDVWVSECKELLASCLNLKLITRGRTWSSIADELWQCVLFSEFVFDLPEELPEALSKVPKAPDEARAVIEHLCESLRDGRSYRNEYIERAEEVQEKLLLPTRCSEVADLGDKETFSFEERSFLGRAIAALTAGETDVVKDIINKHSDSVWGGKGEVQVQWNTVRAAMELIASCRDCDAALPGSSSTQEQLIEFYVTQFREVDRRHREFEQAFYDSADVTEAMEEAASIARSAYRSIAEKAQVQFVGSIENAGWPPADRQSNAAVFDQLVAPKTKVTGRKVAFILVDALRYELGLELEKLLSEDYQVDLNVAGAQLPTITSVGMASLLPGAAQGLLLKKDSGKIVPFIGDKKLDDVRTRMDVLRELYGDRFEERRLSDMKTEPGASVELLVIRCTELDQGMENNPEMAIHTIAHTLTRIRAAVHRLRKFGFGEAVIATDHGFGLNLSPEPGDVCTRPPGDWVNVHDRSLLGEGASDETSFAVPCENVGVRGAFQSYAGPRSLAAYRNGLMYMHGGVSLQEAIVPVLSVQLTDPANEEGSTPEVILSYKDNTTRITTILPVIGVSFLSADLFSGGENFEVLLEAHDRDDNVVGEAHSGEAVNPATGTVTLKPGQQVRVALKMQVEFEGAFSVLAMDPKNLSIYSKLDLKTDYGVRYG